MQNVGLFYTPVPFHPRHDANALFRRPFEDGAANRVARYASTVTLFPMFLLLLRVCIYVTRYEHIYAPLLRVATIILRCLNAISVILVSRLHGLSPRFESQTSGTIWIKNVLLLLLVSLYLVVVAIALACNTWENIHIFAIPQCWLNKTCF